MPTVATYFFAHEKDNKFLNYGVQANAYDFAYTKKDKYLKKNAGQHFGTFVNSGLGGVMQEMGMNNSLVNDLSFYPKLGLDRKSVV